MADKTLFSRHVRHYTVWPSKNRFCCNGRFMTGPSEDLKSNLCVWIMLIVPTALFYGFSAPILVRTSPALPAIVAVFFFWAVVFLLITSFSDPGIIPRREMLQLWQELDEEAGPLGPGMGQRLSSDSEAEDTGVVSRATTVVSSPSDNVERKSVSLRENGTLWEREIDGDRVFYKWCATCHIWRPPRASHCQYCDNCVKEFDHHCPFVANCIGERNYGSFMLFNLSVVALLISVITSVFQALGSDEDGPNPMVTIIAIVVVCVFSLIMFCIMFSFFGFHCWLILSGQTTKEQMKNWRGKGGHGNTGDDGPLSRDPVAPPSSLNPSFGPGRTLVCLQRPPSLIRPRYYVDPQLATAAGMSTSSPLEESDEMKSTPLRRLSGGSNRTRSDVTLFHPK